MNFSWSDDQIELKNAAINFARNELQDDIISRDKTEAFSRQLWNKCAKFGIQGLSFPKKYGGQATDPLTTILIMEGLGEACKDNGLLFGINAQMWSVQMPILNFGSEMQKGKYLTAMCLGDLIGAHGMSEPGAGSDAFSLRTTAQKVENGYVINGSKTFVSNAPHADFFLVFANTNPKFGFMGITGFLVDKNSRGLSIGKTIDKMGLRTAPMAELFFEDCYVPAENRLGSEGNGAAIFTDSMEWERSCILAYYIGSMERQLKECINYANTRRQFNNPIGKYQSVANKIVEMKIRLETARLMLYKTIWDRQSKNDSHIESAITKVYLSESWVKSCLDAIQIHGGYGYMTEYEIERDLRDAISGTLYSGTSEIQRNIIAKGLGL